MVTKFEFHAVQGECSGLVKAFRTGNCVERDWFSGTVTDPVGLLEYENVTRVGKKTPKRKE